MEKLKCISDILAVLKNNYAEDIILSGKYSGKRKSFTSKEFINQVNRCSCSLIEAGIKKGDKVGIMSTNRPEWNFVDFGTMQLGGIIVPLYPNISVNDLTHILKDADIRLLFVESNFLLEQAKAVIERENLSIKIFTFNEGDNANSWCSFLKASAPDRRLESALGKVEQNDILTLIYTAGTTGPPKGVCLTHENLMSNVLASNVIIPSNFRKAFSFLPLSHIFERMVVYMYLSLGISVHYAENMDTLLLDIKEIQPNGFTTVPRVLEKIFDSILIKGRQFTGIKKKLFFWSIEVGLKFQEPENNPPFYKFKLFFARKFVLNKWNSAFGGKLVCIISGGAALQTRLARIFWAAKIPVLEGYGLTETSPVIAVNGLKPGALKFGSVGRPLRNLQVKIEEDGEIVCKGPSVAQGYYNNDEATRSAFDEEGFFHTGDIGELTKDGFLVITDRKKEMFKTAGGKYISPQTLENKYMESPFIGQIMVIGENQRFPAALIVPEINHLKAWSRTKGIPSENLFELLKNPAVLNKYQEVMDQFNGTLGHWEQVKKFILLPEPWSVENGELTPKLSLKRKVILNKYQQSVLDLYKETS